MDLQTEENYLFRHFLCKGMFGYIFILNADSFCCVVYGDVGAVVCVCVSRSKWNCVIGRDISSHMQVGAHIRAVDENFFAKGLFILQQQQELAKRSYWMTSSDIELVNDKA